MRIFIHLLNTGLHFTTNKLTILTHIEEAPEQLIILNPHTNLNFSSNNAYFDSIPINNVTDKFTIIRDSVNFFNLVSFRTWDLKRKWVIVSNDWKRKTRKETSQKPLFKIFCFNESISRIIKGMQNLSNKENHVTLQNDDAKYRPLQFVSWLNFIGRFKNLCPGIGGKVLTD